MNGLFHFRTSLTKPSGEQSNLRKPSNGKHLIQKGGNLRKSNMLLKLEWKMMLRFMISIRLKVREDSKLKVREDSKLKVRENSRTILLKTWVIQNNLNHSVDLIVKLFWNLLYSFESFTYDRRWK
ncbi:MAG: hypothetical protein ACTS5A_01310 [Candidatus Hodgkinia cicadicola]